MTSTSRDTRQPARSRTQVRLRVNFGSLGNYGAPRRPRWRRPPTRVGDSFRRRTVRVGPLRSRDGLGSTSWPSPIGPTSTVAVDIGMTAESWALRPAACGSHRGRLGLLERRFEPATRRPWATGRAWPSWPARARTPATRLESGRPLAFARARRAEPLDLVAVAALVLVALQERIHRRWTAPLLRRAR